MKQQVKLMLGDNISSLKKLPENSIDSVVTDGPYGLTFMNKKWDYDVPSVDFWKEVYRVLKPGGHILSFGGTRTYHRMVVNIEDAGFEIRDQIMWLYGSGFPKSHNIGKAVDKLQGNEREVVGESKRGMSATAMKPDKGWNANSMGPEITITKGTSPYEGWGTALKPANEPICVARKPLSEKSVAENVLKWGTGGINIDGCRIGSDIIKTDGRGNMSGSTPIVPQNKDFIGEEREGRFPANIILECICDEVIKGEKGEVKKSGFRVGGKSENSVGLNGVKNAPDNYNDTGDIHTNPGCPCYQLDSQSGVSESKKRKNPSTRKDTSTLFNAIGVVNTGEGEYNDKGGASRFFYQAKVSKKERNLGLDGFDDKKSKTNQINSEKWLHCDAPVKKDIIHKNNHPTIKPINLMTYLCRLITPEGGIVLDPFMGSGSTGIAARLEGFRFLGMEMDEDYFKIAESRIDNYELYRKFIKKI